MSHGQGGFEDQFSREGSKMVACICTKRCRTMRLPPKRWDFWKFSLAPQKDCVNNHFTMTLLARKGPGLGIIMITTILDNMSTQMLEISKGSSENDDLTIALHTYMISW